MCSLYKFIFKKDNFCDYVQVYQIVFQIQRFFLKNASSALFVYSPIGTGCALDLRELVF